MLITFHTPGIVEGSKDSCEQGAYFKKRGDTAQGTNRDGRGEEAACPLCA